jgi:hypothetical protein
VRRPDRLDISTKASVERLWRRCGVPGIGKASGEVTPSAGRRQRRLQGKAATEEVRAVEGAGQGTKPLAQQGKAVAGGEGGSRGRHLVAAEAK